MTITIFGYRAYLCTQETIGETTNSDPADNLTNLSHGKLSSHAAPFPSALWFSSISFSLSPSLLLSLSLHRLFTVAPSYIDFLSNPTIYRTCEGEKDNVKYITLSFSLASTFFSLFI